MADAMKTLADLPPSAKLVYFVLKQHGPIAQKALSEESLLSPRTIRYAINRLQEIDMLTKPVHLQDTRQTIYEAHVANRHSATRQGDGDCS